MLGVLCQEVVNVLVKMYTGLDWTGCDARTWAMCCIVLPVGSGAADSLYVKKLLQLGHHCRMTQ